MIINVTFKEKNDDYIVYYFNNHESGEADGLLAVGFQNGKCTNEVLFTHMANEEVDFNWFEFPFKNSYPDIIRSAIEDFKKF